MMGIGPQNVTKKIFDPFKSMNEILMTSFDGLIIVNIKTRLNYNFTLHFKLKII